MRQLITGATRIFVFPRTEYFPGTVYLSQSKIKALKSLCKEKRADDYEFSILSREVLSREV